MCVQERNHSDWDVGSNSVPTPAPGSLPAAVGSMFAWRTSFASLFSSFHTTSLHTSLPRVPSRICVWDCCDLGHLFTHARRAGRRRGGGGAVWQLCCWKWPACCLLDSVQKPLPFPAFCALCLTCALWHAALVWLLVPSAVWPPVYVLCLLPFLYLFTDLPVGWLPVLYCSVLVSASLEEGRQVSTAGMFCWHQVVRRYFTRAAEGTSKALDQAEIWWRHGGNKNCCAAGTRQPASFSLAAPPRVTCPSATTLSAPLHLGETTGGMSTSFVEQSGSYVV